MLVKILFIAFKNLIISIPGQERVRDVKKPQNISTILLL